MITVIIPPALQRLTAERAIVIASGLSVGEILDDLDRQYPGLQERICDIDGEFRRFMRVCVNGKDVRFAGGKSAAVTDGDEVSSVPAIAGGM